MADLGMKMNNKFEKLKEIGAGEFEHLNGSLIKHLTSTFELLKQWQASGVLCDAGLYHAAYGTDGFDSEVLPLSQRTLVAEIIGQEAEALVYLYCSCDRAYTFADFNRTKPIAFKDRFTGDIFELTPKQAKAFCELTVANELELAIDSSAFLQQHKQSLYALFIEMEPWLSESANKEVQFVLNK